MRHFLTDATCTLDGATHNPENTVIQQSKKKVDYFMHLVALLRSAGTQTTVRYRCRRQSWCWSSPDSGEAASVWWWRLQAWTEAGWTEGRSASGYSVNNKTNINLLCEPSAENRLGGVLTGFVISWFNHKMAAYNMFNIIWPILIHVFCLDRNVPNFKETLLNLLVVAVLFRNSVRSLTDKNK